MERGKGVEKHRRGVEPEKERGRDMNGKNCGNCEYMNLPPTAMPCVACKEGEGLEPSRWEQAGAGRGPERAATRMPMITVLGYAIEGVKDQIRSTGLLLTDSSLGEKDLADIRVDLQILNKAWAMLEEEREALRKEAEHVKDGDA